MLRWGVFRIRNGFSARVGGRASKQASIDTSIPYCTVLYGGTKQQASASGGTWGATRAPSLGSDGSSLYMDQDRKSVV